MTNAELLQMAQDNLTRLTAAPAPADALRKIIEAHEIVFAVFPGETDGAFDTHLIKGKPLVPGASSEELARLTTTAVPCSDLSEALAMDRTFGDGRPGTH